MTRLTTPECFNCTSITTRGRVRNYGKMCQLYMHLSIDVGVSLNFCIAIIG